MKNADGLLFFVPAAHEQDFFLFKFLHFQVFLAQMPQGREV